MQEREAGDEQNKYAGMRERNRKWRGWSLRAGRRARVSGFQASDQGKSHREGGLGARLEGGKGVTLESALGKGMLSRADSRSRGPRGLFTLCM